MNLEIDILELFSGIGGFSVGLENAGFKIKNHYFSEVDKHAIANYKYNFPNAKYIGSVTALDGTKINKADIMTFGFPCQDLSLAGKRLGFKGQRSSLFYHAARILRENQSDVFIWENVAGLLSSNNGKDIECVFEELYLSGYLFDVSLVNGSWFLPQNRLRIYSVGHNIKYLQKCLITKNGMNPKYGFFVKIIEGILLMKLPNYLIEARNLSEQRQKDLDLEYLKTKEQNQFLGQNKKKKFLEIISTLPLKILKELFLTAQLSLLKLCDINKNLLTQAPRNIFLTEDIKLDTEKECEMEIEKYILNIEMLLKELSDENFYQLNKYIMLILINETTVKKIFSYAQMQVNIEMFIIQLTYLYPNCWDEALSNLIGRKKNIEYAENRYNKNFSSQEDDGASLRFSAPDEFGNDSFGHLAETGRDFKGVFPFRKSDFGNDERKPEHDPTNVRTISGGGHSGMTLVSENEISRTVRSGGRGSLTGKHNWDVICVAQRGRNPDNTSDWTTGIKTEQRLEENTTGTTNTTTPATKDNLITINTPKHGQRKGRATKISPTLESQMGTGGDNIPYVNNIRRLTEIECERLQGFPDDWTKFGIYEKQVWTNKKLKTFQIVEHKTKIPKTQRYKLCGNAVMTDCVKAIGERLIKNYYL